MNKVIIAIVIVAVVLGGGYIFFKGVYRPVAPARQASSEQTGPQVSNVVTYSDAGYSPASLNIKKGWVVTFKNQSSQSMWTASGVHPSHRVYSGTSLDAHCPDTTNIAFDACRGVLPGQSWSFTFNNVGTWGYHNHLNPDDTGAIVVE